MRFLGMTNETENVSFSNDELHRLKNAFQDKKFLELFEDYIRDVNSVDSRKKYEEEIILLEKERGFDVKFIHPNPSYVLKFLSNGKKIFTNICSNKHVGKPSSTKKNGGTEWKIPVILSKPRDDIDRKEQKCEVYDVIFHPDTLNQASKSQPFKGIVEDTAVSMISQNFNIPLDLKTAKYPKLKYKGKPPHVVLRQKIGSKENVPCESLEEYLKKHFKPHTEVQKETPVSSPVTPEYAVKYRDIIDMKDFSLMGYTDKCAPKEIVVQVKLPNVEKTEEIILDIFERKLQLNSFENMNHCYKLDLNLSYAVKTKEGKAKFDKSRHMLTVQLPLKDRGIPVI